MANIELTIFRDGTIASLKHDAGSSAPFYSHCNDEPDGSSADYVSELVGGVTEAWFKLKGPDDVNVVSALSVDIDVDAVDFVNDTCILTARLFAADNDVSTPLSNESSLLADETDTTRVQRSIALTGLTGTAKQWRRPFLRLTFTHTQNVVLDGGLRVFGLKLTGTYTQKTIKIAGGRIASVAGRSPALVGGG